MIVLGAKIRIIIQWLQLALENTFSYQNQQKIKIYKKKKI